MFLLKIQENQEMLKTARQDTKELTNRIISRPQNMQKYVIQTCFITPLKDKINQGATESFYLTTQTLITIHKGIIFVNGCIKNAIRRWDGFHWVARVGYGHDLAEWVNSQNHWVYSWAQWPVQRAQCYGDTARIVAW